MYYWEYDEEAHRWAIERDVIEKGQQKGINNGLLLEQIRLVTKKSGKGNPSPSLLRNWNLMKPGFFRSGMP